MSEKYYHDIIFMSVIKSHRIELILITFCNECKNIKAFFLKSY